MAESEAIAAEPMSDENRPEGRSAARHSAREVALQVLYAIDLASEEAPAVVDPASDADVSATPATPAEIATATATGSDSPVVAETRVRNVSPAHTAAAFDRIVENFVVPTAAADFARELVMAVVEGCAAVDALLGVHARNWRVDRMAAVDRNVLRIAVYELRDTDTPVAVVIDEAVDLARRFGADSSPAFVNGVLDAVAREVRGS